MRPQIIILEGADCTGKSTLMNVLQKVYACPAWHMTCTPALAKAMRDYQVNAVQNAIRNLGTYKDIFIFDRLWPSEMVYGPILRPEMDSFKETSDQIRHMMSPFRVLYIFCMTPAATDLHEKNKDPSHPYDAEVHQRVCDGYMDLYKNLLANGGKNLQENERLISYNMERHNSGEKMLEFVANINKRFTWYSRQI